MKKPSLLFALFLTGITIFSCMQDAPSEVPKGILKITSPLANDNFAIGDTVHIQADAVMLEMSKVDFFVDGALKGSDANAPYNFDLLTAGMTVDKHIIKAISYGEGGSIEQCVSINLIVGVPPIVNITNPSNNANIKIGTPVDIMVDASDADGSIKSVSYYINGNLLNSDTSLPYSCNWATTGLAEGAYTLKAVAKDNMGIVSQQQVMVNLFFNLPDCIIEYPTGTPVYDYGQTVKVRAKVTESKSKIITNVKFYLDNNLVQTTSAPDSCSYYFYNWSTTGQTTKNHSIKAVATNHNGNTSTSNIVSVILNQPPIVNITSPADGQSFYNNTPIPITANASDPDGTISEVKIYIDNIEKAVLNTVPYAFNWVTTGLTGNHTLKTLVKDNDSRVVTSSSINITLIAPSAPTVTTLSVSNISYNTAIGGGDVTNTGGASITARGVCWSGYGLPVISGSHTTDGLGVGTFNSNLAGLYEGNRYIVRAYATNSMGTSYGDTVSFKSLGVYVPIGFVTVQGGTFQMGQPDMNIGGPGYSLSEQPEHPITLSSFYIGKYEITQAEWTAIMGSNPSSHIGDTYPVEQISWYDVLVYCNKRSLSEGLTPCYTINGSTNPTTWGAVPTANNATWNLVICNWAAKGYRMPTEAEWEYAARGGNSTHNYTYPGSNIIGDVAWYGGNSGDATHHIGTRSANELGIYDMSGNVWEWNWDWYSQTYYSSSTQTNPYGPSAGECRSLRGGSWYLSWNNCRSTTRWCIGNPNKRDYSYGVRLSRSY